MLYRPDKEGRWQRRWRGQEPENPRPLAHRPTSLSSCRRFINGQTNRHSILTFWLPWGVQSDPTAIFMTALAGDILFHNHSIYSSTMPLPFSCAIVEDWIPWGWFTQETKPCLSQCFTSNNPIHQNFVDTEPEQTPNRPRTDPTDCGSFLCQCLGDTAPCWHNHAQTWICCPCLAGSGPV